MEIKSVRVAAVSIYIALFLAGCGTGNPEDVVKTFSDAMISYDTATMKTCYAEEQEELIEDPAEEDEEITKEMIEYLKETSAKTTYKITNSEKGEKTATITVKYNYDDITPIVKDALGNYMVKALAAAFTGGDDSEYEEIFMTCFNESAESKEPDDGDAEIKFSCVLVDKVWKIKEVSDKDALENVMTCNLAAAFSDIENAFASAGSSGADMDKKDADDSNGSNDKKKDAKGLDTEDLSSGNKEELTESIPQLSVELVDNGGTIFNGYSGDPTVSCWFKYKNTSDAPVKFEEVYIDYYDSNEKLMGSDQNCQCIPEALKPGETGYIYSYYYGLGGVYTDNGCVPSVHYSLQQAKELYTVDVEDKVFKTSGFGVEITCKAKNNTPSDITFAEPGAVYYDADGEVVGFCYGVESFSPGQEKTFNISGSMLTYGMDEKIVDSVEVFIQGDNSFW